MSDEPFYSPKYQPPPKTAPRPGELLFEFVRESDRRHFRCELRYHGEHGVEAQFYVAGDFLIGRRFDTRALAVEWAGDERTHIEREEAAADWVEQLPPEWFKTSE